MIAQFGLGSMYQNGIGIKKNIPAAKKWFEKSCLNGYIESCNRYQILNQR